MNEHGLVASGLWVPPDTKLTDGQRRWEWLLGQERVRLSDERILRYTGPTPVYGTVARKYLGPKGMIVLVSLDPTRAFGRLLHASVSVGTKYPDWDTIVAVKRAFFGDDLDAMMALPAERDYVHNDSPEGREVFHITEMPERWGMS